MLYRSALIVVVLGVVLGAVRADEVVVKTQVKPIVGTVKGETAKEVQVQPAKGAAVTVPSADVIEVVYTTLKLATGGADYNAAKTSEKKAETSDPVKRKAAWQEAIKRYSDALEALNKDAKEKATHGYAARHFEYKIARLTLNIALSDGTALDKGLAKIQAFRTNHPDSWQINQVMPLIVQLQMDAKKYTEAELTLRDIAKMNGLPEGVRRNAEMKGVQLSVLMGKLDQANAQLDALLKKAGSDVVYASEVTMVKSDVLVKQNKLNEAVPLLQKVIKDTNDKNVKAKAHNTLGECLFNANRHEEALWEFLWVDTVYNQDKEQRAKALYFLWQVFLKLNNAERAQECQETLISECAGTEYQQRALAKSK